MMNTRDMSGQDLHIWAAVYADHRRHLASVETAVAAADAEVHEHQRFVMNYYNALSDARRAREAAERRGETI